MDFPCLNSLDEKTSIPPSTYNITGKGIDKELIADIFKPGVTTKTRGWGLGLSLSKRIIEDYHKGKLFLLDSNPSDGTSFAIFLPKESNIT